MSRTTTVTLRLTNSLKVARTVILEPWTGEYTLRPGSAFEIVAEGDTTFPLEVELSEDRVIVYCFDSVGAQFSIFENGQELTKSE